jgi:RNase P/RNase MRP subunit p30
MRLTANEMQTLRQLLLDQLAQMREAERVGIDNKVAMYQARINVLDKVIDNELIEARDELVDEDKRITIRQQEGRL